MLTTDQIMSDLGDSVMYTLHAHTQFCDGRNSMAEFAEKAAAAGFTHYGFTPHSPLPIESSCNMSKDDVAAYFAEFERLRTQYPNIHFYKGMEIDYLDDSWGPANPYFTGLNLDYAIGSVHFVPNQEGVYYDIDGRPDHFKMRLRESFDGDVRYVVDQYFRHSMAMVAAGGFQIIGHFDKIKHNAGSVEPGIESTDFYKSWVNDLIDAIIQSGVIVEINTKSWKEFGQLFPAQHHWKRLLQAGVNIVVNSDAHYIDRINAARPEVLKALHYVRSLASPSDCKS